MTSAASILFTHKEIYHHQHHRHRRCHWRQKRKFKCIIQFSFYTAVCVSVVVINSTISKLMYKCIESTRLLCFNFLLL